MLETIMAISLLLSVMLVVLLPFVAKANGKEKMWKEYKLSIALICFVPFLNLLFLFLAIKRILDVSDQ